MSESELSRADPVGCWASQDVVVIGELSQLHIFLVVAWARERCPQPSIPEASKRAGPEFIRAGEMFLPLISCSTQESGPTPHLDNTVELDLKL